MTPPVDIEALRALCTARNESPRARIAWDQARSQSFWPIFRELESLRAQLAARDEEIKGLKRERDDARAGRRLLSDQGMDIGEMYASALASLARKDALLREAEEEARRILADCKWMTGDKAYQLRFRIDRAVEIAGRLLAKLKAARGGTVGRIITGNAVVTADIV